MPITEEDRCRQVAFRLQNKEMKNRMKTSILVPSGTTALLRT